MRESVVMISAQKSRELEQRPTHRHGQAGQATVEFVLSLSLMIFMLLAALDFGRAFFSYIALVNAAREGAHAGVMTQNPANIDAAVRQELQGSSVIDLEQLEVSNIWDVAGQCGDSPCVVVNLSYHFNLIVTSFLPYSSLMLRTSATMAIP